MRFPKESVFERLLMGILGGFTIGIAIRICYWSLFVYYFPINLLDVAVLTIAGILSIVGFYRAFFKLRKEKGVK